MVTKIAAVASGAALPRLHARPLVAAFLLLSCNPAWAQGWIDLGGTSSVKYKAAGGIHVVSVNLQDPDVEVKPVLTGARPSGETTTSLARRHGAIVAINGGFFSFSDHASLSFVKVDGRVLSRPEDNASLWNSANVDQYAFRHSILARSELRIFGRPGGGQTCEIASPMVAPSRPGYPGGPDFAVSAADQAGRARALHVLQGGPRLLPSLRNAEEGFTYPAGVPRSGQDRPGVNATARRPRTAICLTPGGAMAMIVLDRSKPMSNRELSDWIARNLPTCSNALAMDSGGSSTLYVMDRGAAVAIGEGNGVERPVSSALLVLARVPVPSVEGMPLGDARQLLGRSGFQANVERYVAPRSPADSNRVARQSLQAGTKHPSGSRVSLVVFGEGAPAAPMRPPGCSARPSLSERGYLTDEQRQCLAWRDWMKRNRPQEYQQLLMTE